MKTTREDNLVTTITPFFAPVVSQWKQQIVDLECCISTIESAVGTVFCDSYYGAAGFDYNAFFEAVQNRVDEVQAARVRAQIQAEERARAQAQIQAMQQQAAGNDVAM